MAVADVTNRVPALETPGELCADDVDPEVSIEDVVGRLPVFKVPDPEAEFDPGPTGKVIEEVP